MKYPEVTDMVRDALIAKGFDGLWSDDGECACDVSDLAPCGDMRETCKAGYKIPGCTCGEGCDFHIGTLEAKARAAARKERDDDDDATTAT